MDPVNGMVMMTGNSVEDTATYSCDAGYSLSGVDMVTCLDDGQWSDPPPTCVPIPECSALNDPANGTVTWTSLTTGGVATYECDPGFELVEDEMRDCQGNSQWSGEAPICRRRFILSHSSCVHTKLKRAKM